MEDSEERRKHQRLPLKLAVLCQEVGASSQELYSGESVNVSPGGMLMQINGKSPDPGGLLTVEMSVPPTPGLLEYGGRFTSHAKVLRTQNHNPQIRPGTQAIIQMIALEFCEPPRLNV